MFADIGSPGIVTWWCLVVRVLNTRLRPLLTVHCCYIGTIFDMVYIDLLWCVVIYNLFNLFSQFVDKLSSISSKTDEHFKSLCLLSLPSEVFHKITVFNGFNHVSVSDVQRIIEKMPAKTSSIDLIVFLSHLLNRVAIFLVIYCQNLLTCHLLKVFSQVSLN